MMEDNNMRHMTHQEISKHNRRAELIQLVLSIIFIMSIIICVASVIGSLIMMTDDSIKSAMPAVVCAVVSGISATCISHVLDEASEPMNVKIRKDR